MVATNIGRLSLRKNDQVQVISGREKGKIGKLLSVSAKSGRVLVEKVNMVKKNTKPTQKNPQGGILEKEASLHYSNVLLMCPKCNRGVRHGYKMVKKSASKKGPKGASDSAKEAKVRVCKRCGESLDLA
ncbi:MAG: 50S ribosomal protein L24 [Bdellovibrionales bacterium RIFOXYC1_FULL_54_43]|nr:MAG: 50S ribosomal protein L24 [Bdellovibrionales bacterium RIFOXYC1_FULL_54_43]OFZ80326.1 MAG: 50S ribosomal protein L24 [Bdellovibrionales bacterium RIFOXYD1_FULL_55_31]